MKSTIYTYTIAANNMTVTSLAYETIVSTSTPAALFPASSGFIPLASSIPSAVVDLQKRSLPKIEAGLSKITIDDILSVDEALQKRSPNVVSLVKPVQTITKTITASRASTVTLAVSTTTVYATTTQMVLSTVTESHASIILTVTSVESAGVTLVPGKPFSAST